MPSGGGTPLRFDGTTWRAAPFEGLRLVERCRGTFRGDGEEHVATVRDPMLTEMKDASRPARTLLDAFCLANRIETGQLGNSADVSRQQINRMRSGKADTRIGIAKKIARGASYIVGREVAVGELFDLDFEL